MCGIAGFWKIKEINKEFLTDTVTKMSEALNYRGPDDSGIYVDDKNGIALGHRRLSILDLSPKGHQPMESFSGRYVIVYNGEVYNFLELKTELGNNSGVKFKSDSDTEVILAGMEVWGIENTIKKMNGMFAFALWDKKEKKLCIARDRAGIKPVYFGVQNDILFFASELKALRVNDFFKKEIDADALASFFRFNYIPAPYSIYKNIKKLKPAHYAVIDSSLNVNIHCYWDIKKITEEGAIYDYKLSEKEAISDLETLLLDSVKKMMVADVPLGAFLSGGIDSTTVTALMQKQSSVPVKTFTIGFDDNDYNEAKYAKDIANYLGTEHMELYVTPKEAQNVIPKLPDIYDEPFSDSSQIPTFLVSQLTKKYVTVSLSGDGGDELFGGYTRYFMANNIRKRISVLPHFSRIMLAKIITLLSPEAWNIFLKKIEHIFPAKYRQTLYGDKLYKLANILNSKNPDEIYKGLVSHFNAQENLVLGSKEPLTVLDDKSVEFVDFNDRMMFYDLITYLPDDILTKVDRASMSVSLEARVPLLDHRVVEFSKTIPLSFKIRDGKGKWILRQVLNNYVPKKMLDRPKMGFGIPIGDWLRGPLKDWADDLLNENKIKNDGLLNYKPIKELWSEHLNGKRNWQYHLWDVLMFQAWKERWM
jgi:asparagine synthase (glutamine-hydrolysing)